VTLARIGDLTSTTVWKQGWLLAPQLGIPREWCIHSKNLLDELVHTHIILVDKEDELVWDFNESGGSYFVKLRYKKMLPNVPEGREIWWENCWRINAPLKSTLFMWLILHEKFLTWNALQRRSFQGPSMCSLCRKNNADTTHLFLTCPFSCEVWYDITMLVQH
jgi:hypothetical protein